ncbi:mannose-1-phosphate guanylyltransferase/mannose-6-phosphate isomerase [Thalassobaculum sp.]|uniref:mannose-1-phosphate guanylyltransferase/mannose-6-phosphate isomerase n=1 Tax=Thalassobaculum sp. TaxID=2022740 RepID=UPI003B598091
MVSSTSERKVTPVILSGGSGSRLWPLSRALYPKQFLSLAGEKTMLQESVLRLSGEHFSAPLMICNEEHRFIVAEQLRSQGVAPAEIVLEPIGRNTAPAVCVAALILLAADPNALMLVCPSDHVITQPDRFIAAVTAATEAASQGNLVSFGIQPSRPETGYGYIATGVALDGHSDIRVVDRFVEKPDLPTAQSFLDAGTYVWNSGIFLFSAATYLAELERTNPEIVEGCKASLEGASWDLGFCRLAVEPFGKLQSVSIDYAVMEKTDRAVVVPVDMGWNDIGAWSALWEISAKDEDGNVTRGNAILQHSRNVYAHTDHPLIAISGLDDIVVVATDDAILIADRNKTQDIKQLVTRLQEENRNEFSLHTTVHRPWGHYRSIDRGNRFQVKRITVNPGQRLSLQMHHHRAEHWVVVEGTALVTRGPETMTLEENESIYIPAGMVHRLENPGKAPLHLIEVQTGSYLGEDDIVRFEDGYGRVASS